MLHDTEFRFYDFTDQYNLIWKKSQVFLQFEIQYNLYTFQSSYGQILSHCESYPDHTKKSPCSPSVDLLARLGPEDLMHFLMKSVERLTDTTMSITSCCNRGIRKWSDELLKASAVQVIPSMACSEQVTHCTNGSTKIRLCFCKGKEPFKSLVRGVMKGNSYGYWSWKCGSMYLFPLKAKNV